MKYCLSNRKLKTLRRAEMLRLCAIDRFNESKIKNGIQGVQEDIVHFKTSDPLSKFFIHQRMRK